MSVTGIHGQTLEVTVVGCNRLKDTEWFSRQDPYVSLQYGSSNKFLSSICIDGDRNPTFQEKFLITLVEGLRELNVAVWNSNTFTNDNLIGSGKVQIQKVLSQGFDDTAWTIQSKSGRYAGEVRLIMHYSNANKPMTGCAPSAPEYHAVPSPPQVPLYSAPPPAAAPCPPPSYPPQPAAAYPPQPSMYPPPYPPQTYPPQTYPPQPSAAYPPPPSVYPPQPYPTQTYPPQPSAAYPPPPSVYPPQTYPPQPYPPQGYPPNPY